MTLSYTALIKALFGHPTCAAGRDYGVGMPQQVPQQEDVDARAEEGVVQLNVGSAEP